LSDPYDGPEDMRIRRRRLDDTAAERLLRARPANASDGDDDIRAFVAAVAALEADPPVPTGRLATLLAEGFDPATLPASSATLPRRRPARRPLARLAAVSLAVKVLVAASVGLAGVATATGAGVLPDKVQDGVGGVLESVTPFDFPSSTDRSDPPPAAEPEVDGGDRATSKPAPKPTRTPTPTPTTVPLTVPVPPPTPSVPPTTPTPTATPTEVMTPPPVPSTDVTPRLDETPTPSTLATPAPLTAGSMKDRDAPQRAEPRTNRPDDATRAGDAPEQRAAAPSSAADDHKGSARQPDADEAHSSRARSSDGSADPEAA
jgi:outer membrane biosynthesis protein TonB